MNMQDILDIVIHCPLFQNLPPGEATVVIENGRVQPFGQSDHFFHQGDEAIMMYLLLSGHVKLSQVTAEGDQVILGYLGPGDGLGIIVALSQMPYPLTAEAMTDSTAVAWTRHTMQQLMLRYPQLALNGMDMIGRRFARLQTQFQELATERVEQRVARALIRLIRQFGKRTDTGILIDMPLSREDLAQMTGTNLYNVSRILSKWEQNGLVSTGRKQITVCHTHRLVAIAEDLQVSGQSGLGDSL